MGKVGVGARERGDKGENWDRAKRGLATPRCLSPALRPSQLSARYAWAEEKEVGVGVGVGVRKIRELAIPCSSLPLRSEHETLNTEHIFFIQHSAQPAVSPSYPVNRRSE